MASPTTHVPATILLPAALACAVMMTDRARDGPAAAATLAKPLSAAALLRRGGKRRSLVTRTSY